MKYINGKMRINAEMIKRCAFAAITAVALCLNMEIPVLTDEINSLQSSPEVFWNMYLSLQEKSLLIVFAAVFSFFDMWMPKCERISSFYNEHPFLTPFLGLIFNQ